MINFHIRVLYCTVKGIALQSNKRYVKHLYGISGNEGHYKSKEEVEYKSQPDQTHYNKTKEKNLCRIILKADKD